MKQRLMIPAVLALVVGTACSSGDQEGRQTARVENTVTGGAYDSIYQRAPRAGADESATRNAANAGSMGTSRDTVSSGTRALQPAAAGRALGAMEAADQLEIRTAQLALQRARSAAVRHLAETLLQDHRAHLQQVEQLATEPGLSATPPTDTAAQAAAVRTQLERASGQDFDLAFVQLQIDAHRRNIAALTGMHGQTQNDRVDGLIGQTLPTLRHHLELAETAKRQLGAARTPDSAARDSARS
jgi:putative membrane protein